MSINFLMITSVMVKNVHTCCSLGQNQSQKKDSEYIESGSVLGFHNDDSGKQIKINILLSDLKKTLMALNMLWHHTN